MKIVSNLKVILYLSNLKVICRDWKVICQNLKVDFQNLKVICQI